MNIHPQLTPFKNFGDVRVLKDWFYNVSEQNDRRPRAIQKVAAYATRGNIPHSLEATSLIVSSVLLDEQLTNGSASNPVDQTPLRLSYTMSLIKFCNGLLDPYQRSTFALSMHKLAEILKLPSYFVEIRHIGTHEFMPSLELLRYGANNALIWLEENYWNEMLKYKPPASPSTELDTQRSKIADLNESFRTIKKIRRDNLNKVFKFGDSTETGTKYWKCMNSIRSTEDEILIFYLIFKNCLISKNELNERKTNGIRLLYKPVLEELGYEVVIKLVNRLLVLVNSPTDENANSDDVSSLEILSLKNNIELEQALKWLEYLLGNALRFGKTSAEEKLINKDTIDDFVSSLTARNSEANIRLFRSLIQSNERLLKSLRLYDRHCQSLEVMEKYFVPDVLQISNKKRKGSTIADRDAKRFDAMEPQREYFFEPYESWKPTPFGKSDF